MEIDLLKKISFPISTITLISFLILVAITSLQIYFQDIFAEDGSNSCPQTMSMGATYVDKQGCIRPCPTSTTQGEVPAGCPTQSSEQQQQQQQSGQSGQQQQQQQPLLSSNQEKQQPNQNGNLVNKNSLIFNNPGPLDTKIKGIGSCANDLTGKWIANDGGVYYIKQKESKSIYGRVYAPINWFGSTLFNDDAISKNKGFSYSNTANGFFWINDPNSLLLQWADLSISDNHFKGVIQLSIDPSGSKLTKVRDYNGFGPSEWTRQC